MAGWLGQVIRGRARRVSSWSMRGMPLEILRRRKPSSLYPTASVSLIRCLGRRGRAGCGASCGCWAVCLAALALLFAVAVCCVCPVALVLLLAVFAMSRLHCCSLFLCYCGPGRNFQCDRIGSCVPAPDMPSIISTSCYPAAHGLLSLFRLLLRAFRLHVIERNRGGTHAPQSQTSCVRTACFL